MTTTPADLLAVQRAHATEGRDAALAEIRRRWPNISDTVLVVTLERILAAPLDHPPVLTGRGRPHRDAPGLVRRNRGASK